jgi:hypothetical protein
VKRRTTWWVALALGGLLMVASSPAAAAGRSRSAVEWAGFGADAQHTATATERPQPFHRIRWTAKVDLAPDLGFGELLIHYGSPMITAANTVVVPTRVSAKAGFRVVAYDGRTGARRWSLATDYRSPSFDGDFGPWTPPLPAALTPSAALAVPARVAPC